MMNVKFRKATAHDWEKTYPLLEQMGLVRNAEKSQVLFEEYVNQTHHGIIVADLITKNQHQAFVGYAWAQSYGAHLRTGDSTARLNDLFVLTTYRKQGIAKGLLEAITAWAKESNIKYLQWQANKASVAFYERLGFVSIPDPDPEHPFFEIEF